ncbi:MAG: efflux transporter periplasmic adaptor subunit, partial [Deltaproteobacteria bacterium]|nr:efflux transporter periplasmic adaptor subunit [Deltaproteobacteria bacterium]
KFYGYISFIDPFVNEKTKTARVRIEVDNRYGRLKPGMYAKAVINSQISSAALTIPESAVIRSGKSDVVFIDQGGGKILPRTVTLGHEISGRYQVKKGLKRGQKVIISATFLLNSESNLQETIKKMMQQAGTSGGKVKMPGHH